MNIAGKFCIFLVPLFICGCTSIDVSDLSTQDVPTGGITQSQEGVTLRVVPLTNGSEVKKRFGSNLLKRGTVPVFVEFDNRGTDSFIVSPEKCSLGFGSANAGQNSQQPRSFQTAEGVEYGATALGSPALLITAAVIATGAQTENHQYAVNQLQSKMLSPGAHHAGYLYFNLPSQARGNCSMVVPVQKSGGVTVTFSIPLNLNPE